jgi:hypothetical protein
MEEITGENFLKYFFLNIHWVGLGYGGAFLLFFLYDSLPRIKSKILARIVDIILVVGFLGGFLGMFFLGEKIIWVLIGLGLVGVTAGVLEWLKR